MSLQRVTQCYNEFAWELNERYQKSVQERFIALRDDIVKPDRTAVSFGLAIPMSPTPSATCSLRQHPQCSQTRPDPWASHLALTWKARTSCDDFRHAPTRSLGLGHQPHEFRKPCQPNDCGEPGSEAWEDGLFKALGRMPRASFSLASHVKPLVNGTETKVAQHFVKCHRSAGLACACHGQSLCRSSEIP